MANEPPDSVATKVSDPVGLAPSRLSTIVISVVCVVAVCVLATWPRWHQAVVTVQLPPENEAGATAIEVARDGTIAPAPETQGVTPGDGKPSTTPGAISGTPSTLAAPGAAIGNATTAPTTGAKRETGRRPTIVRVPVSDDVPATWQAMTPQQQDALQPFAECWPHLSDLQKRKWIAIASVYPRMSPDAQQRLHERMLRWTQMTPEQRRLARENYEMSRVLPPNARQQAWRAYEALPPAQRAKFAAAEKRRQPSVVSAPPSEPRRPARHSGRPGSSTRATPASGTPNLAKRVGDSNGVTAPASSLVAPGTPPAQPARAPSSPEPSVEQH